MTSRAEPLRIGVLGCAGVVDYALVGPAQADSAITVEAIASRTTAKAEQFAAERGIARSYGAYRDLLGDREIDAVYVALPNSMHHEWSIAALRAGFPVLCEKPLACSAAEAADMAAVAEDTGLPLVEAVHWRHHPVAELLFDAVRGLGTIRTVEVDFHVPAKFMPTGNFRLDASLGGGSLLDQGCYCTDLVRLLGGGRPEVVSAEATLLGPGLDGAMQAVLRMPGGAVATVRCSMNRDIESIECRAAVTGEHGAVEAVNPFLPGSHPFLFGEQARLVVVRDGDRVEHQVPAVPSYVYQARHFVDVVRAGKPDPAVAESVENMMIVDDIHCAAGM